MRYIIFSDIHGNNFAFDGFLKDIKNIQYDRVIFLGDFIGYYYSPEIIIQTCIDMGFKCLLGNHDSYFLKMIDGEIKESELVSRYGYSYSMAKKTVSENSISFLRSLSPLYIEQSNSDCKILFCHGSPASALNGRIYPDSSLVKYYPKVLKYTYVIFGHTHHKMTKKIEKITFINPGSMGQQRDGKGCSYVLLDTENGEIEFKTITYDIDELEKQVDSFDNGNPRLKKVLRRSLA